MRLNRGHNSKIKFYIWKFLKGNLWEPVWVCVTLWQWQMVYIAQESGRRTPYQNLASGPRRVRLRRKLHWDPPVTTLFIEGVVGDNWAFFNILVDVSLTFAFLLEFANTQLLAVSKIPSSILFGTPKQYVKFSTMSETLFWNQKYLNYILLTGKYYCMKVLL